MGEKKNVKRIGKFLWVIPVLLVIGIISAIFVSKNSESLKLGDIEENKKQAYETGVSDPRFQYTVDYGSAILTKYIGTDTDVVIPSTIDGYKVTSIADRFLSTTTIIENLTIPASIDIKITNNNNSKILKNIYVEEGHTKYTSKDGILYNKSMSELLIYPGGKTDISFEVPNGITTIGIGAFYNAQNLVSVIIPETVTKVKNNAFVSCYKLKSIEIPDTVIELGSQVFADCFELQKAKLPKSLSEIGSSLFSGCKELRELEIPDTVTSIRFRCIF